MAACRTIASWRWRSARMARCGSAPMVAWRGLTRMVTGRPTARPAPRAVCRTIPSSRWRSAADGTLWVGTEAVWRGSTRTATGRPTARPAVDGGLPDDRVCGVGARAGRHPVGWNLWRPAWRGSTRTATGRPTLRPTPTAACRTIKSEALAFGADGSLWVGTDGGLARLDKDGHWQTYSEANTDGGLPNDHVTALALGADGALWVGTPSGGLGYFIATSRPNPPDRRGDRRIGEVTQAEQTIAVVAFDGSYLTQPGMFHYIWRVTEIGLLSTRRGLRLRRSHPSTGRISTTMARISFASLLSIAMATGASRKTSTLK